MSLTLESDFILGEFRRSLDERFRLSLPAELLKLAETKSEDRILAKERPGCLSLWSSARWGNRLETGVQLVRSKMQSGRLEGRVEEVQALGRLLSTRHRQLQLAGRGRLLIPEGFRGFLGVEPGGEVMVVGAAVCIEIWRPDEWLAHINESMPSFGKLLDQLAD